MLTIHAKRARAAGAVSSVNKVEMTAYGVTAPNVKFYMDAVMSAGADELSDDSFGMTSLPTQDNVAVVMKPVSCQWAFAYASPSRHSGGVELKKTILSNPSLFSGEQSLSPGQSASITAVANTAATDNDATEIVFYRRKKTQTGWSETELVAKSPIGVLTINDTGGTYRAGDYSGLSSLMPVNHDMASSARYVLVANRRVYAACLDWDAAASVWRRPCAIDISSFEQPWYFPTDLGDDPDPRDGGEIDGYAVTGNEFRGWGMCRGQVVGFLDNECFIIQGDSWQTGWMPVRLDAVGCRSSLTIADCLTELVWHGGDSFYSYTGAGVADISRDAIDSTLIEWNSYHCATYHDHQYVLYCSYNGHASLLVFDLVHRSWRVWSCPALRGIAADRDTNCCWGINDAGWVVKLFTASTNHFADTGVSVPINYEVETQWMQVGTPGYDYAENRLILDVEAASTATLTVTVRCLGTADDGTADPSDTFDKVVGPGKTRYTRTMLHNGHAVKVNVKVKNGTPPIIHFIGVDVDETPLRS